MRHWIHNLFVGLLILLASVTFTLTAVAGWTHQTVLGTDRFVSVVTDATSNPVVIASLGERLADQVVDRLGLEGRLENLLPPALDRLANPITQAVHDRIAAATIKLFSDPSFQVQFSALLTRLHDGLLNVVNGDAQYFTTTNGKLTLDLLSVMDAVVVQLQSDGVLPTAADFPRFSAIADRTDYLNRLSTYVQTQLPPDFGQIPIVDASAVDSVANALRLFDQAMIAGIILTIVLAGAGVLFAHRHWNAIAWLGGTILVMLGLLIAGLLATQHYSNTVVANPDNRVLVGALVGSLTESLVLWLAALAVAVLMITLPVGFIAHFRNKSAAASTNGATA